MGGSSGEPGVSGTISRLRNVNGTCDSERPIPALPLAFGAFEPLRTLKNCTLPEPWISGNCADQPVNWTIFLRQVRLKKKNLIRSRPLTIPDNTSFRFT